MRVVLINTVCGKSGSVGRITAELLNYAEKNGIDCYAAFSRGKAIGINPEKGISIGGKVSFYTDIALSRLFDSAGFNNKSATKKLLKKLDELAPDIIHLHNIHGYYIDVELLFDYIKNRDIKVVWTLHDCWAFTGHCAYFSFVECEKWKTGCFACQQNGDYPKAFTDNSKKNYIKKSAVFTSLKKENVTIVTPSKWLKSAVEQSFLNKYSVEVIPNGIDVEAFSYIAPTKNKFASDKKTVLGVTNVWDSRKGFNDFKNLALSIPEYNFIAIGLIKSAAGELPKNLTAIERTNDLRALAEYYSAADVFVNPTYDDNYPTTHMEAQSCGTAVISYDVGGCSENIITPYGKCVERGNISALSSAVKQVCLSGYNNEELSLKAKALFDKSVSYGRYINLYKQIKA